jgi:hypothetical protein
MGDPPGPLPIDELPVGDLDVEPGSAGDVLLFACIAAPNRCDLVWMTAYAECEMHQYENRSLRLVKAPRRREAVDNAACIG